MMKKELRNQSGSECAAVQHADTFGRGIQSQTAGTPFMIPLHMMSKTLAICVFAVLAGCTSPAQKVEDAKENVTEAKEDLKDARLEYAADVEAFRIETNARIEENERLITSLRVKIRDSKGKLKADFENQVLVLEQKNNDLKLRMSEYKADSKEGWTAFKTEFGKDMDELGSSIKNFTIDSD